MARSRRRGRGSWREKDPTQIFYHGLVQETTEQDNKYVLRSPLASSVDTNQVEVMKRGDELFFEDREY